MNQIKIEGEIAVSHILCYALTGYFTNDSFFPLLKESDSSPAGIACKFCSNEVQ